MSTQVSFERRSRDVVASVHDDSSSQIQPSANSRDSDVDALSYLIRTAPERFPELLVEFHGTDGAFTVSVFTRDNSFEGSGETRDDALSEVLRNHFDELPLEVRYDEVSFDRFERGAALRTEFLQSADLEESGG